MSVARNSSVSRAAGLVLAARWRAIRLINENVVVARGAHDAVNRLAELIVRSAAGMFGASLFACNGHRSNLDLLTKTILAEFAVQDERLGAIGALLKWIS